MTDNFVYGAHKAASSEIMGLDRSSMTYDRHTLYLMSGPGTEKQLTEFFKDLLQQVKRFVPDLDCRFKTNVILNREGGNTGISYVYIVDSRAYFMILGKNPDGSDRVIYEESEEEKAKSVQGQKPLTEDELNKMSDEERTKRFNDLFSGGLDDEGSWAVDDEITSPKVRKELGSAVRAVNLSYTEEQKRVMRADKANKGDKTPVPESFGIIIKPSYVDLDDKPDESRNVLYLSDIPEDITEEDLTNFFSIFNNNHVGAWIVKCKSAIFTRPYPGVRISKREVTVKRPIKASDSSSSYKPEVVYEKKTIRQAFIVFSPNNNDGLFALQMTKKFNLKGRQLYTMRCKTSVFETEEKRIVEELMGKHDHDRREKKRMGDPSRVPKAIEDPAGFKQPKGAWGAGKLVIKNDPIEQQKTNKTGKQFASTNMFSMLSLPGQGGDSDCDE